VAEVVKSFALTFIPLLVAMDAVGVLPFYLSLVSPLEEVERRRVLAQAVFTGLAVGLGFLLLGRGVFLVLDIHMADFLVAGGLLLFALAARDLLLAEKGGEVREYRLMGVFPLGTPLVVGPAVLTTLLLLLDQYGYLLVAMAFALNLAVAWLLLAQANRVAHFLGQGGLTAVSKVSMLFLAAIAVKMVRQGLVQLLAG